MNKELVSIIIPCYNAEPYLNDCFESLLNQTYKNLEIIIVNDGSTDKSEDIIDMYQKRFISQHMKFIKINQKNQGQAAAINAALKKVTGQYLMWQDADDWYEKDAVENLLNCITIGNFNLVRGEAAYRDEEDSSKIVLHAKSKTPNDNYLFDKYIFETDSYCFAGIFMVKMNFFDTRIQNRTIFNSRAGQNWQLILPITYNEEAGYLNKIVYNVRIVENSHSHSVKKLKSLLKRQDDFLEILINVLSTITIMPKKEFINYKYKIKIKTFKNKIKVLVFYNPVMSNFHKFIKRLRHKK